MLPSTGFVRDSQKPKTISSLHTKYYFRHVCKETLKSTPISEPSRQGLSVLSSSSRNLDAVPKVSTGKHALIGVGAGTSVAIAAWTGVQIAGIASTGTAIGGIYGAAASNAGWAAFGGGSLATGGGGMALGHLVLPGIGIAVAVAYVSVVSHAMANDLNRISDEMKMATEQNRLILVTVDASSNRLVEAENRFNLEDDKLSDAISTAQKQLFRFGWLSKIYKDLRYRFKGFYYTPDEESAVSSLNKAVENFMKAFGVAH